MRQRGRSPRLIRRWMACVVLCAFLRVGAPPTFSNDATPLGPAPISGAEYVGRVSAIAASPTDFQRYYAGGADGGVWGSVDGGATWVPLTDDLATTAIGALTLDPTDENVIYAGTGESNYANHSRFGVGLFKSIDSGMSWTHLAESVFAGRAFSRIIVNPQNPQVVYAAITRAGGFPELAAAKGHPGATGDLGVFRSLDGGVTWMRLTGGLPNLSATDLAMDPSNPSVLYAGIGRIFGDADNGIYKSTDGGDTWTRLTGGLPTTYSQLGRVALAIAPSMSSRVYALITNDCNAGGSGASTHGAYRSDDGGATWTDLSIGSIQESYGWYLCVVSVDPADPDTVFMGGLNLLRSKDAGGTWSFVTPAHVDMHALAWDANGRLLCGNDGGFYRTSNGGGVWHARNNLLGTVQFYAGLSTSPVDDLFMIGGTQDNGTNRRTTDSVTWNQVLGGDGGWTQIDPSNSNRMFAEFQGSGNLYRSVNGGASFSLANSGINSTDRNCFLPPYVYDPSVAGRMLYATHRIYQSTNNGSSWTAISGDLTNGSGAIRALAIAPSDSDVCYAATNDGNVLVSFDGGSNWDVILSGMTTWPRVTREIFVDPTDAQTMYLATNAFGETQIRRTTDAGQTWVPLDATLPDVPVNVLAVDVRPTQPVIYAGTESGVYRSIDDGGTWHPFGNGLPNAVVIDLRFEPDRMRLIVATQGRGAWTIPASLPGDVNFDGTVDLTDLGLLLGDYDCTGPDCIGDVNGDGVTNLTDLAYLLGDYGS